MAISYTELAGKTFTFSLPPNHNKNGCKLLRNEERFIEHISKLEGFKEIERVNVCGIYAIHFDADISDRETIAKIDSIAKKIGFER